MDILMNFLEQTIRLATPITLAAIGATICERAGIVNIAMEGIMLVGAFFAALVAERTGNPWMGMFAGMMFGAVFSLLHAVATIHIHLDHVVSGAVLNILAFGITKYSMMLFYGHPGTTDRIANTLGRFRVHIPFISQIPVIGRLFFSQTPIITITFALVIFFYIFLFKTKTGLHIRAAGEHPLALETLGVSVYKMRYLAVLISGITSGLAGAYLSIENSTAFTEGMSNGRGFIALAANISGGWHPIGSFIAATVFGFLDAIQYQLQALRIFRIPYEIFLIFPYLATVIAVAGLVKRSRPPKALGIDFMIEKKGE